MFVFESYTVPFSSTIYSLALNITGLPSKKAALFTAPVDCSSISELSVNISSRPFKNPFPSYPNSVASLWSIIAGIPAITSMEKPPSALPAEESSSTSP